MNHDLLLCLIGAGANLVGMLAFYAAVSHFLARLAWGRGGMAALILLVVLSQLFWIPLAVLTATEDEFFGAASFSAWFGNWLVTGFALVLLQRTTRSIPKSLEETARLDGIGGVGIWRHVVLSFVRRDLTLLASFLLMALLMSSWYFVHHFPDDMSTLVAVLLRPETLRKHIGLITAASLLGAIPLVGIFFASRKR
jgi:ABC-type glycerol-3-phosphate transport system permease component